MAETNYDHPKGWGYFNHFSRVPLNAREFRKLPYLKEDKAKEALAISGIGIAVLIIEAAISYDPWAEAFWRHGDIDLYLPSWIILISATALIGIKQWSYYYSTESSSPKGGIFKDAIKQVSQLEKTLDLFLAAFGAGLLVSLSVTPFLWFAGLSAYSALAMLRCYFTLKRKDYSETLKKKGWYVPAWYAESLDRDYKGMIVKYVLGGWMIIHFTLMLFSAYAWWFLYYHVFPVFVPTTRLLYLLGFVILTLVLYLGLSRESYEWGKGVARRMHLEDSSPTQVGDRNSSGAKIGA